MKKIILEENKFYQIDSKDLFIKRNTFFQIKNNELVIKGKQKISFFNMFYANKTDEELGISRIPHVMYFMGNKELLTGIEVNELQSFDLEMSYKPQSGVLADYSDFKEIDHFDLCYNIGSYKEYELSKISNDFIKFEKLSTNYEKSEDVESEKHRKGVERVDFFTKRLAKKQ